MRLSRLDPVKVFVDCRWYAQPGQGVVTYIDGLHRAAEQLLSTPAYRDRRVEFWYGVETLAGVPSNLFLPRERTVEVGRRSMLWRLLAMPGFLRRHGFAAAHFSYVCPLHSAGVAYVTTMYDVLFLRHPRFFSTTHRLIRRILYGRSARRSDIVLTISEQSEVDVRELLGRTRPIDLVYCAPGHVGDDARIVPERVADAEPGRFFLSVGRVEPRKNYPALVRAFRRSGLAERGARLVLVGFCADEFADELRHIQNEPGVAWLSRVSDAQLKWLYAHAKAFVFPSFCEGFGIPVIEAMQAGLPVAVADTYPLPDVVAAADEHFDPADEEQMAESLRRLWAAPEGARPRPAVLDRYTWENAARSYLAALAPLERRAVASAAA